MAMDDCLNNAAKEHTKTEDRQSTNTDDRNKGHWNTGYDNVGNNNTGNHNAGDRNTGNRNKGRSNVGSSNIGDGNTGSFNVGHCNVGDYNIGCDNIGCANLGDKISGDCSVKGDFSFFCTKQNVRFFNKPFSGDIREISMPPVIVKFMKIFKKTMRNANKSNIDIDLMLLSEDDMRLLYYQHWRKAWDKLNDQERKETLNLPNFDNNIFKEITGIDVYQELGIKVVNRDKPRDIIMVE